MIYNFKKKQWSRWDMINKQFKLKKNGIKRSNNPHSYMGNFQFWCSVTIPRLSRHKTITFLKSHIIDYPTPISLTYAWSFGALAGLSLVVQMVSGFFLSMHYTAHVDYAFNSIEYIMRDVPNGWFIRYVHANGASMFFMVVYAHICRGLYYGSYMKPRQYVWCSGVILLLLALGTAFTGYVLPWGQMSFWSATVITNMVTAVPVWGQCIAEWLWGGYTVNDPTLRRFYSLHFVLPFLMTGLSILHLILLHEVGSTSPVGSDTGVDDLPFYPYFVSKDLFAFLVYLFVLGCFVYYTPNFLNQPDNYIRADSIHMPAHVVPEWYLLPYYAILRSIPHKASGIITMFASILILLALPFYTNSTVRNTTFRPIFRIFFWFFLANVVVLAWIGQKPVKDYYTEIGRYATAGYFLFFLVLVPLAEKLENFFNIYTLKLFNEAPEGGWALVGRARKIDPAVSEPLTLRARVWVFLRTPFLTNNQRLLLIIILGCVLIVVLSMLTHHFADLSQVLFVENQNYIQQINAVNKENRHLTEVIPKMEREIWILKRGGTIRNGYFSRLI